MRSLVILLVIILGVALAMAFMRGGMESGSPGELYGEVLNGAPDSIVVKVDDLGWGDRIPEKYTCDGSSSMPVISWSRVDGAGSYAVIVYDPDAPGGVFYHLAVYNIPGNATELKPGTVPEVVLKNSAGSRGWYPPCPPPGHGDHRYYFLVIALQGTIQEDVAGVEDLADALKGRVIAYGALMGVYGR